MTTANLTAATFERTIDENDIVIVDFWASWCGPCMQFAPIFAAAASEHPDIVFGKIDTEAEQALASAAQITSIPTLMAFKNGQLVFRQAGALPAQALLDLVRAVADLDTRAVPTDATARQGRAS